MDRSSGHVSLLLAACLALFVGTEPDGKAPEELPSPPVNLDVEYARVKLELAQANLNRAESRNKKVANTVTPNVLAQYYRDVDVAKLALENARQGKINSFDVWLEEVAAQSKSAEASWQSAIAANKRMKETVNSLDVERLRLRAELLRLNLERGRALIDQPREKQLEWQLSAMNEQIARLSETVLRSPPAGGGSRSIWYIYDVW